MASVVINFQPATSARSDDAGVSSAASLDREQLTVHVNAVIVTEQAARRAVNRWLTWDVGEHLVPGQPELVLNDKLMWRMPVKWTSVTARCTRY